MSRPGAWRLACRRKETSRFLQPGAARELLPDIDILPVPSYYREQPSFTRGPAYEQDDLSPTSLVKLENIGYLRGVRVATLLVFPVQYDPRRHFCRTYHEVTVQVKFTGFGGQGSGVRGRGHMTAVFC